VVSDNRCEIYMIIRGGPGRWSRKMVSDNVCQINIYMIIRGGPGRWSRKMVSDNVCQINIYMIIRGGPGRWSRKMVMKDGYERWYDIKNVK